MSGLLLRLKPYEKFLVGKVVLQNGGRRSQLRVIEGKTGILRLDDALHPDRAQTPLSRAYIAAQAMLVEPESQGKFQQTLVDLLESAAAGFIDFAIWSDIERARIYAGDRKYYRVMKCLKPLLSKEASILFQLEAV